MCESLGFYALAPWVAGLVCFSTPALAVGFVLPRAGRGRAAVAGSRRRGRVYRVLARLALADGPLAPAERMRLVRARRRLALSDSAARALERDAAEGRLRVGRRRAERRVLDAELQALFAERQPSPEAAALLESLGRVVRGDREVAASDGVRCAYCHDGFEQAAARCGGCGTLLHAECRRELGRCPTPGCSAPALAPTRTRV
ncbi:MAG: hypothetical protein R3F62_09775 [Planctomycetota bacterium]